MTLRRGATSNRVAMLAPVGVCHFEEGYDVAYT